MGCRRTYEKRQPRALAKRKETLPLTPFQKSVCQLLAQNRSPESHLAGGAALHFEPHSVRFSVDLDYFHDSETRVAHSFEIDKRLLEENGFTIKTDVQFRGYIRGTVKKQSESTKIEWAQDSDWRFLPVLKHPDMGYVLSPVDLAINKLLALVGRDEIRDFVDTIVNCESILPLGAQIWAACGKDPGYSPTGLLSLLKRRGKYRPEDLKRLYLAKEVSLIDLKEKFQSALLDAEQFLTDAPSDQLGCLFFSKSLRTFVQPVFSSPQNDAVPHYGRPGGVIPIVDEN